MKTKLNYSVNSKNGKIYKQFIEWISSSTLCGRGLNILPRFVQCSYIHEMTFTPYRSGIKMMKVFISLSLI